MKSIRLFCTALSFALAFPLFAQTINKTGNIYLADPTILLNNGVYYLYGTVERNASNGFLVYTSTDLENWEGPKGAKDGYALKKGDAFGESAFWAPQVFSYKNKFYMAYTANEQIAIAESDSPLGPFMNPAKQACDGSTKQIDPFIYIDPDGKKYIYHVRFDKGNNLYRAEMSDDLMQIKSGTVKNCIKASDPWENTKKVDWPVTEGPTIIRHKDLYYFLYSANDFRNPDYAVGYATSKSLDGPWVKSDRSPVISSKNIGMNGTGHGDIFFDKQGAMWYVFHTHNSETKVGPRKAAIVKISFVEDQTTGTDNLAVDKSTFKYLMVKGE